MELNLMYAEVPLVVNDILLLLGNVSLLSQKNPWVNEGSEVLLPKGTRTMLISSR
jgi:hypothetical protein